ncbi:MAG: hypothetical protein PHI47_05740 [Sulfuricurvum sp.]|uniref:hypothetical protein n=1 Tax=Sulfuricurvum sp. TaxID=2025608 RepID=UPI002610FC2E|nr:hypothetical protein [Sulfuricurvum sp.]MDD5159532.1 hypothetical protein [Sulfuricurvum sp.]
MTKITYTVIALLFISGCSSSPHEKVENELTDFYIQNGIYEDPYCRARDINNSAYVLCTPRSADESYIGGMYQVEYSKDGAYKIYSINGKAATHIEGNTIATERHGNEINIDISESIKLFN